MKQIRDLHNKHNKYPEYTNFHLTYNYDSETENWKFMGYRCVKCGRTLHRNVNGVPKHQENCKEINKTRSYKTVEIDPTATVLDNKGNIWKPLEFNQN